MPRCTIQIQFLRVMRMLAVIAAVSVNSSLSVVWTQWPCCHLFSPLFLFTMEPTLNTCINVSLPYAHKSRCSHTYSHWNQHQMHFTNTCILKFLAFTLYNFSENYHLYKMVEIVQWLDSAVWECHSWWIFNHSTLTGLQVICHPANQSTFSTLSIRLSFLHIFKNC